MDPFTIAILGYWAVRGVKALIEAAEKSAGSADPRKIKEIEELAAEPIYFAVAIMAKFVKSDGVVTKKEIAAVEAILRDLELTGDNRAKAINVFRKHKEGVLTYNESLTAFAELTRNAADLRGALCILLMRLAHSDGPASQSAIAAVQEACSVCAVEFANIEQIFCAYQTEMRAATTAAYETLCCNPSDTLDGIRKRYRYLTKTFHPDTLFGKELPPELIKLAEEKFRAIQEAYERIISERNANGA